MLQRLLQPNEGSFQIQPTYIPNPMSGPSGKSLKNCFAKPHLETSGFANILFGTSSDFPWCRSTSVSRQSSTSDKAVVEFTQDNQGLWIDRWPFPLLSLSYCPFKVDGLIVGMYLRESWTWPLTQRKWKRCPNTQSNQLIWKSWELVPEQAIKVGHFQVRQWLQDHQGKRGLLVLTGPAGKQNFWSCFWSLDLILATLKVVERQPAWLLSARSWGFMSRNGSTRQSRLIFTEFLNIIQFPRCNRWIMGRGLMRSGFQETAFSIRWNLFCAIIILMELEIQGKNGQFKEWLRGAKYSNLSSASGLNRAKLILLEDLPGYSTIFFVTIFSRGWWCVSS